ncbi:MAG TPA: histidine phosphatase family protein [Deferrisomatales bacterium]|nr:histidine phosphatase family protein [Deferrisomatales bacterium]
MAPPTHITFVRHGEVHNPRRMLYGRLPRFRLSARGRAQAVAIAAALADHPADALVSSPMLRALQTARILLADRGGLRLSTSALLNEVLTPYQGCLEDQVRCRGGDFYTGSPPQYEQPQDVLNRVRRFADRMVRRHPGGHVLAVTHGDPSAFFTLWAGGAPVSPSHKARLAPLGVGGGYPSHASASTYAVPGDPGELPRLLAYRVP